MSATAAQLGFVVRSDGNRDDSAGLILIRKRSHLSTAYCDVQHVHGRIVAESSGSF